MKFYRSPITVFESDSDMDIIKEVAHKVAESFDNTVLTAVQGVGIDVDKDELAKALAYDRGQYEKGYADAKSEYEPKRGEWQEKEIFGEYNDDVRHYVSEWQSARCSVCGKYHTTPYAYYFDEYNFCPNCGADMRKEK